MPPTDPIDFPVPRPLTPAELADPTVRAVLRVSHDAEAYDAAWEALEPDPLPGNATPLDHRDRRP